MKGKSGTRLLCLLVAAAMIIVSAPALRVDAGERAATKYLYETGHEGDPHYRIGIKSVAVDGKTYYDIAGGNSTNKVDITQENAFLKAVITNKASAVDTDHSPLEYWSILAEQIFASNAKYCGATNNGNFANKFTKESREDLESGHANISDELAYLDKGQVGSTGKDNTRWTGWAHATSLKDLRQKAADYAAESIGRHFDENDFLSKTDGENTLANMKDDADRDVWYTMVSALDREGVTNKYHYNVWGLGFYDFEIMPLTSNGIEYVTAAQKYDSIEAAASDQVPGVTYESSGKNHSNVSYFENKASESADVETNFEQESSLTASNSLETGKEYHYTEGLESESTFDAHVPLFGGFEETIHISFSAEQVISFCLDRVP